MEAPGATRLMVDGFVFSLELKSNGLLVSASAERDDPLLSHRLWTTVSAEEAKRLANYDTLPQIHGDLISALRIEHGASCRVGSASASELKLHVSLTMGATRKIEYTLTLRAAEQPIEEKVESLRLALIDVRKLKRSPERGPAPAHSQFCKQSCNPNFDVRKNGLLLTKARGGNSHDSVLLTGGPISSGFCSETIQLVSVHNSCMLGIVADHDTGRALTPITELVKSGTYPGHGTTAKSGRAYYCHNGHIYHNDTSSAYGIGNAATGYLVSINLDITRKKVWWEVNGRAGAEWDLPSGDNEKYYIVVNLYTVNDAVRLLPEMSERSP